MAGIASVATYLFYFIFQVKNIEAAMKDVKAKGIRLLSEKTSIGAHGKPVVFLHPKDCNGVLTELEEE
jgi:methylmalonyl-CoA/ethylmalonyl-CoA epimerase